MTNENSSQWKDDFYCAVTSNSNNYKVILQKEYDEILSDMINVKLNGPKTSLQYRRLKRYDVLEVSGISKLIAKCNDGDVKYFIPLESVFDILLETHIAVGHGGRDRMLDDVKKNMLT